MADKDSLVVLHFQFVLASISDPRQDSFSVLKKQA